METRAVELVCYIRNHGIECHPDVNGTIRALEVFTFAVGDGTYASGSQWVTLPAELGAVRDWLGY